MFEWRCAQEEQPLDSALDAHGAVRQASRQSRKLKLVQCKFGISKYLRREMAFAGLPFLLAMVHLPTASSDTLADARPEKSVRVLVGPHGKFAGDDFECVEKDVFRDAPWARGACMIGCHARRPRRSRCAKALRTCEMLSQCAAVEINVEGTVATLKRASALSRRTSLQKQIEFTQNRHERAPGTDRHCDAADESLRARVGAGTCLLDCPKLNCTQATALCYEMAECIAVDVGFGFAGRAAVARLRFQPPAA